MHTHTHAHTCTMHMHTHTNFINQIAHEYIYFPDTHTCATTKLHTTHTHIFHNLQIGEIPTVQSTKLRTHISQWTNCMGKHSLLESPPTQPCPFLCFLWSATACPAGSCKSFSAWGSWRHLVSSCHPPLCPVLVAPDRRCRWHFCEIYMYKNTAISTYNQWKAKAVRLAHIIKSGTEWVLQQLCRINKQRGGYTFGSVHVPCVYLRAWWEWL